MATIFIQTLEQGDDYYETIVRDFIEQLIKKGHEVHRHVIMPAYSRLEHRARSEADYFISLPYELADFIRTEDFINELDTIRGYVEKVNKLLFVVYVGNSPKSEYADYLSRFDNSYSNRIFGLWEYKKEDIQKVIDSILEQIYKHGGSTIGEQEIVANEKKKIDASTENFASRTISSLHLRERNLRWTANICFGIGFCAIIVAISLLFAFSESGLNAISRQDYILDKVSDFKLKLAHADTTITDKVLKSYSNDVKNAVNKAAFENVSWSLTVFFAIKSLLIITLLLAASRYAFNLAKAYMVEALKIADRIHAIRFGQFYLQVYNNAIEPSELKDVFSDWNISNTDTAFHNQKADDWDPKYFEKALEMVEKVKAIANKD